MKGPRLFPLIYAFTLSFPLGANILPILPHPNADELTSPVFLQTFAGLNIVSFSNGIGISEPFFDTLPPGAIPGPITSIIGNSQGYGTLGDPRSFEILGVQVTQAGSTFTPQFGRFNFVDHASVTFIDSQTFDSVTFSAGDPTVAYTGVPNNAPFQTVFYTNLPLNASFTFQIVEPTTIPEPMTSLLLSTGFAVLMLGHLRRKIPSVLSGYKKAQNRQI